MISAASKWSVRRFPASWHRQATIGMLAALLAILIYIWFRFEWQFAVGAIIATLHDVIMTIGFFVITGLEFNLTVACSHTHDRRLFAQ